MFFNIIAKRDNFNDIANKQTKNSETLLNSLAI